MTTPGPRLLTRRGLLYGGAALGLAGAIASCSNEGRGDAGGGGNDEQARSQVRPTYLRYEGVAPDLSGAEFGIPDAFMRYPAAPVLAVAEHPGDGQPISVTTNTNTPIPPNMEINEFWQEFNSRVGSTVNLSLTPSSDYNQKFATSVAGDSLGDIFLVGNVPQVPQLLASMATDLTPHLSGDNIIKYPFLANLPEASWNACIFGGRIYAVPLPRGAISSSVLYGRADIIEAEGFEPTIGSAEEFVELCRALTDERQNRFALAATPITYVRNMFDMPNIWAENSDGSLSNFREHEAHEEAFAILTDLWKSGFIHPDAYSGQNLDMKVRFVNGSSPLSQDSFSAWSGYTAGAQPGARIAIIPPPMHDGSSEGRAWLGNPTIGVTAINKAAEGRVETMLAYLNYLATPFGTEEYLFRKFGVEGVHFDMVDGNPILNDKGLSETKLALNYQADAPWTIFLPDEHASSEACFNAMKDVCPGGVENPVAGMYSETDRQKGAQINGAVDDVAEDIVTGRKPFSAWTDAVAQWKRDGGDQIAEEYAQALADSRN